MSKNKESHENVYKNECALKDLKKILLTLESDYNYHQSVTKRNECDLNEVINEFKQMQNHNNDLNLQITNQLSHIKFSINKFLIMFKKGFRNKI